MSRHVRQAFQPDSALSGCQAGKPDVRRAIATLEMVMVMPLLLMLMAGLFLMGRAIVRKETAATSARQQTWQQIPNAAPGDILQLGHDPMASAVSATATQQVDLRGMFGNQTLPARSRGTVLGRPWDVRDLPFARGQGTMNPHRQELDQIARNLAGVATLLGADLSLIRVGLDPNTNLVAVAAAAVGRTVLNPVVQADGWTLKYITAPAVKGFQIGVEVAKAAALADLDFPLADLLDRIDTLMGLGVDAFDNLYEASRGRPGNWDPDLGSKLLGTLP